MQFRQTGSNSSGHEPSCTLGRGRGEKRKQTWGLRFRWPIVTYDWPRMFSDPCCCTMPRFSAKIIVEGMRAPLKREPQPFIPIRAIDPIVDASELLPKTKAGKK